MANVDQIVGALTARIRAEEWPAGAELPSLTELAAQHGVSQSTILEALEHLARQQIVSAGPAWRYTVRPRPPAQRLASERFSPRRTGATGLGGHYFDFEEVNVMVSVDVERIAVVSELPERVSRYLSGTSRALMRHRTYTADGIPTQIATSYVPLDIAETIPLLWQPNTGPGGMYARFGELGYRRLTFVEDLTARLPTPEERQLLQVPRSVAVLEIDRVVSSESRVLEVCLLLLSGDQYVMSYKWSVDRDTPTNLSQKGNLPMPDTPMHSVAMVGIVPFRERILCVQRQDNARWEPPAGVLERDETFQDCVEREVMEETGVKVRAKCVTGLYKNMTHPKRPVTVVWLCEYISGEPKSTEESRQSKWLTITEVQEMLPPAHAARVMDAVNAKSSSYVTVRYHNGTDIFGTGVL